MPKVRDEHEGDGEEFRIERYLSKPEKTENDQEERRGKRLSVDNFNRVDQRLTNHVECFSSRIPARLKGMEDSSRSPTVERVRPWIEMAVPTRTFSPDGSI